MFGVLVVVLLGGRFLGSWLVGRLALGACDEGLPGARSQGGVVTLVLGLLCGAGLN